MVSENRGDDWSDVLYNVSMPAAARLKNLLIRVLYGVPSEICLCECCILDGAESQLLPTAHSHLH